MEKILKRINKGDASVADIDLLLDICNNIEGNTVCALGEAAAWPVRGFVTKFRGEFEAKVRDKREFLAKNITHGKRSEDLIEISE
jgi:NADH-quinone oxidoreductase subunit F